jgi:hypothetical protein
MYPDVRIRVLVPLQLGLKPRSGGPFLVGDDGMLAGVRAVELITTPANTIIIHTKDGEDWPTIIGVPFCPILHNYT